MASNALLLLVTLASTAVSMIPPCLPELGPEFCPCTAAAMAAAPEWPAASVAYPQQMYQENVLRDQVFPRINKERMINHTKIFTTRDNKKFVYFPNRSSWSSFGADARRWIAITVYERLMEALNQGPSSDHVVSFRTIANRTPQQSFIVKILPDGNWNKSHDIVIIGAHIDSTNYGSPSKEEMIAPGADDNASGFVVAAEEEGLLGSSSVFKTFRNESRSVKAVLNLDMVGYSGGHEPGSPVIAVHRNHTNGNLTTFTKNVIENYSIAKAGDTYCGYECSDHASAWESGFPSAGLGESAFLAGREKYPYIHSENDTIDHLDFDYMVEFVKVSAGFVAELAYTNFTAQTSSSDPKGHPWPVLSSEYHP